jgi:two-component system KDP operon response regulator KdpE
MGRLILSIGNVEERRKLCLALERQGHSVTEADTPEQAVNRARHGLHDLVIVECGSDLTDLHQFCRDLRSHCDLGVILLLGDSQEQRRIDALNAGADDYLLQPFTLPELLARVRAILRRLGSAGPVGTRIALHDRVINLSSHKIEGPGDRHTALTPTEFLVLKLLIDSADKPVTNCDLARGVWAREEFGDFEYVRIMVSQLRRKLEGDYTRPRYILTERSVGYRFTLSPALQEPYRTGIPATAQ